MCVAFHTQRSVLNIEGGNYSRTFINKLHVQGGKGEIVAKMLPPSSLCVCVYIEVVTLSERVVGVFLNLSVSSGERALESTLGEHVQCMYTHIPAHSNMQELQYSILHTHTHTHKHFRLIPPNGGIAGNCQSL